MLETLRRHALAQDVALAPDALAQDVACPWASPLRRAPLAFTRIGARATGLALSRLASLFCKLVHALASLDGLVVAQDI